MAMPTYTSTSNQRWVKKYRPLDIFTGCTDEAVKNQLVVLPRMLPESSLCIWYGSRLPLYTVGCAFW